MTRFPRTLAECIPAAHAQSGDWSAVCRADERHLDAATERVRERWSAHFEAAPLPECSPLRSSRLREFIDIYRAYRLCHSRLYAAKIAFGCAFRGLPF